MVFVVLGGEGERGGVELTFFGINLRISCSVPKIRGILSLVYSEIRLGLTCFDGTFAQLRPWTRRS